MKLTITKIIRSDKKKDGTPLVTKDGRPYTRVAIQTQEYGAKWASAFSSRWNESWAEGNTVNAKVTQNGEWLNLEEEDPMEIALEKLHARLDNQKAMLERIITILTAGATKTFSAPTLNKASGSISAGLSVSEPEIPIIEEYPQFSEESNTPDDPTRINPNDIPF